MDAPGDAGAGAGGEEGCIGMAEIWTTELADADEDPLCNRVGLCEAYQDAEDVSGCQHCGRELRQNRNGIWWTYDVWETSSRPRVPQRGPSRRGRDGGMDAAGGNVDTCEGIIWDGSTHQ